MCIKKQILLDWSTTREEYFNTLQLEAIELSDILE